ncbi:MAG: hypothetical protein LRY69_03410 [Gammaproteobacteria bacterium]|nr:hypothetical protein [Gammaproteobacteria bacterium]
MLWVKKYLPNTPIELPENWQEIYEQFFTMFHSPQKSLNHLTPFIDSLAQEIDKILGRKAPEADALKKEIKGYIASFEAVRLDEASESLLVQLYVICQSYVTNKHKANSTQTKPEEYEPVINYCKDIIKAIAHSDDVCNVQKTPELTFLLEKKKNTFKGTQPKFSGTRLINKIDEIIRQLSETSTHRLSGSTTTSSSSSSRTTPSKQGLFASRIQEKKNTPEKPPDQPSRIKFSDLCQRKSKQSTSTLTVEDTQTVEEVEDVEAYRF